MPTSTISFVIGLALLLVDLPALAADKQVRSRPNAQGGQTYFFSDHRHPVQCRPNAQGGQTCHTI